MENLKLNDTPVRTARNFAINNIELPVEIPNKIKNFESVEITNSKSNIDNEVSNSTLGDVFKDIFSKLK